MRELEEKEGAESTSERDKSARKSGGYVRVNVIKGRDRRRGERERDKEECWPGGGEQAGWRGRNVAGGDGGGGGGGKR